MAACTAVPAPAPTAARALALTCRRSDQRAKRCAAAYGDCGPFAAGRTGLLNSGAFHQKLLTAHGQTDEFNRQLGLAGHAASTLGFDQLHACVRTLSDDYPIIDQDRRILLIPVDLVRGGSAVWGQWE